MAPIIYGVTSSVSAKAGCLFAVVARVHFRGEPVSSYFSMACYSIVSY